MASASSASRARAAAMSCDVGAGAEMAAGAAQHDHPRVAIDLGRGECGAQRLHHGHRHRVALRRPVQRQVQHRAVVAHEQFAHRRLRPGSVPSSLQMMPSITSSAPPPMRFRRPSR